MHLTPRFVSLFPEPYRLAVDRHAAPLRSPAPYRDALQRRVDTLLRLDSAEHGAFLLAIEAQGKKDPAKPASWAYYTAYLWTKYRLPTALMVVVQDRSTAERAQRPVAGGPPQMPTLVLRPVVAGPHNMPVITDPAEARDDLVLAALAAITHAGEPDIDAILKALSTALRGVPEDIADPIIEFTAQGLAKRPAKHIWRKLVAVDLSFYKSYISEEIRDEGRAEGAARRAAEDILDILEVRRIDVPEAIRERITGCGDPEVLRHWHRRAVTAPTAEDIFTDE
ncbi:hypothetical protein ACIQ9J_18895 [Streptomyces sp. NPDC094153]|uniref:hypothetical protein n=1 Tax=Streptomyces sp. NPDC094153 TaxID=3366058 RepID=UPI003801A7FB